MDAGLKPMEKKLFEFKATMSDSGQIEGYGAIFGNVDRGGDRLMVGCVANIPDLVKAGSLLVGHEWEDLGVATIDDASQDERGLFLKAQFHTDDESQRVRLKCKERLDRGKTVGLSIGYETLKCQYTEEEGKSIRDILSVNVFEVSVVPIPMNPMAGATSAKSYEDDFEGALTALKSIAERTERLKALRAKDGRNLSELNISRIEALAAELKGLNSTLAELLAVPKSGATEEEIAAVHLAYCQTQLNLQGIQLL